MPIALAEALRLLGHHRMAEDRPFLQVRIRSAHPRAARGAAEGLLASFGLEGFTQRLRETKKQGGYDALNSAQKHYDDVFLLDAEVKNGGFAQYFVNCGGGQWREAVAAFEAMNSQALLEIVRGAVAKFGPDGPSKDRKERQEQLAKLVRTQDKLFDDLEQRYFKNREVVEVLVTNFVINNADSFR